MRRAAAQHKRVSAWHMTARQMSLWPHDLDGITITQLLNEVSKHPSLRFASVPFRSEGETPKARTATVVFVRGNYAAG